MIDLAGLGLPALPEPLPYPVIDAHTHLDATTEKVGLSTADLIELARQVGVVGLVQVGCDADDSGWAADCAQEHCSVIANVALHPNDVARHPEKLADGLETIEKLAARAGEVCAIGETGLDYFRTKDAAGQQLQKQSFAAHIELAKRYGLSLVIHDRDAHDDIADLLDAEGWPERVIFHCFSADASYARRVLDRGAFLSFPGTITYKANTELREALAVAPGDRILVETDAPYLTAVPHRGKPNASYLIPHTVRAMAHIRYDDLGELCQSLYRNAEAAFNKVWL